jgi:hypothetical protein
VRVEGGGRLDVAWCCGSVQVRWFVGGGNECTLVGWCLLGAKVRVRWETDGFCVEVV